MHKANNNMADNDHDVIELTDDEESSEDQERGRHSRENGRERNLQPLENVTSVVWRFFRFLAGPDGRILEPDKRKQTEVYCNRCYMRLKYTGGTSNLRYHLEKHHLSEYTQAAHEADGTDSGHSSVPPAKRTKATKSSPEQTITSSFKKMTPLPRTSERYKTLTKAVRYFICKDQQLFDTLDSGICYMFLNHDVHPQIVLQ